ncbi:MAG TPA: DUF5050 domain-containing protein [Syntrophomonadaceae bacterium]|nr:DUF5050 domain-containing protein [Syntrophomonadaceae bacterium]
MNQLTKIITIGFLILLLSTPAGCSNRDIEPFDSIPEDLISALHSAQYGNTCVNISNYGYAAESDGWIYFVNTDYKLYKMRSDGSHIIKLSDDKVQSINAANGYVYYTKRSGILHPVYRMRTDGTGKEKTSISNRSGRFLVVGDWILYQDGESFYAAKIDGTQKGKLIAKISSNWIVDGEYLYNCSVTDGNLYRISLLTGEKTMISSDVYATDMIISEGYLYFLKHMDYGDDTKLYRIPVGGGDVEEVISSGTSIYYFQISGNTIYYSTSGSIVKINISDSNWELVTKTGRDIADLNMAGDWFFYNYRYYDNELAEYLHYILRVRKDGTGDTLYDLPMFSGKTK